ncbi:MAG: ABC transporter permease [Eubacteriales bacterium]|nr:ABC transporter permease [Eubacteriales bacterium]
MIKTLWEKKSMVLSLAKADFKKRFAGSYFGVVWMFIQPVVTVLIFFFIFQLGMKSQPPVPNTPYVIWLIPGLVPWFFFNESLQAQTNVMQEYNYLVKKVVFPVELLPLIKVISAAMVHACFVAIMLLVYLIGGFMPRISWLMILYYSFATLCLSLSVGMITSAVNVFFRDMTNLVGIVLQFGMWLAPIMYWEGMFTAERPWMGILFKLNPFYYIVAGYRDSMLTGNFPWERPMNTLYFWAVTAVLMYVGIKLFKKLKPHFSDVL